MIEIEKKFLLTPEQQQGLLSGATALGAKMVEDSYFDTDTFALTTNDFWFRERDGAYELKAPLHSAKDAFTATNRYNELTNTEEIARTLGIGAEVDFETALSRAGIKKFMTVLTSRKSYDKQGFRIDIDSATFADSSFEYAVAEIELLINSEAEADEAERKIVAFAKECHLVTDRIVLGKVVAFIKTQRPEHYAALVAAGVTV